MDDFESRLGELLTSAFPGSQGFSRFPSNSPKVGGVLLWDGFEDKPHTERERLIWDLFRARLPVQDQQRITAIFGLTQREHESILEDDEDDEVPAPGTDAPVKKRQDLPSNRNGKRVKIKRYSFVTNSARSIVRKPQKRAAVALAVTPDEMRSLREVE